VQIWWWGDERGESLRRWILEEREKEREGWYEFG
jgi:hypothetical protein